MCSFTQGDALGYGNIGLSARLCANVIVHVLAQTLLVTFLRKRYWSRSCANVIVFTSLRQRCWYRVLAILCGCLFPTSYIPILVSFVFLFVKLFFRPDFCYAICSGCVRDDCRLNDLYICVHVRFGNRDFQISPNFIYSPSLFHFFLLFVIVISCAPQRGNFSTAQGIALGMM